MSPSEAPAAAGGELSWGSGKHSGLVWQSEQLSLTQLGPVLKSAAQARTNASARTPVVLGRLSQRCRLGPERERERVPGFTSEKEELPARIKAPETKA